MYPILIKIFGVPIYSYGLMLAIAFLVCIFLALRQAPSFGIAPHHILDLSLYLIVSGIIGARLLHVIQHWSYYGNHPLEIVLLNKGGLSFHGGLFLALLGALLVIKKRKLPLGKVADLCVLYLPLGQAIGRLGCFLNGCCYGTPTTFWCRVQFPQYGLASTQFGPGHLIHPTQIYSALANLGIFLILSLILKKEKQFPGRLVFDYLLLYGTSRFLIEYLRADNPIVCCHLNVPQLVSIAMIAVALIAYFLRYKRSYVNSN